jgi:hypothetical protein
MIIPMAAIALALSAAGGLAQTGGASGTSGGAAAKSGSDATAPMATTGGRDGKSLRRKEKRKRRRRKCIKTKSAGTGGFLISPRRAEPKINFYLYAEKVVRRPGPRCPESR